MSSHDGDDDLSNQLVLDKMTALQIHTHQIYQQMLESISELADALRENVEVRKDIARLASEAGPQKRLTDLTHRASAGISRFLQGAQLLDVRGERQERAKSADLMREGRTMFLPAVDLFDTFLRAASCPAAECPDELTAALKPPTH